VPGRDRFNSYRQPQRAARKLASRLIGSGRRTMTKSDAPTLTEVTTPAATAHPNPWYPPDAPRIRISVSGRPMAESQGGRSTAASLELSRRILPTGEAVAGIGGELDIATADTAVKYVTQVIDHHHGPVIVDLTALRFCDARGLSALLQIALYAEQGEHKFRVASPSPSLVKLLRITALDRKLLGATR
jgi:anti-anti-sigma factor